MGFTRDFGSRVERREVFLADLRVVVHLLDIVVVLEGIDDVHQLAHILARQRHGVVGDLGELRVRDLDARALQRVVPTCRSLYSFPVISLPPFLPRHIRFLAASRFAPRRFRFTPLQENPVAVCFYRPDG